LRKTTKPFITPCANNQIDRNGNCFEPQVIYYDTPSDASQPPRPRVSGCGCIRVTAQQRIKCPPGQEAYNNTCLINCPQGYSPIKDPDGSVISLYCQKDCPEKSLTPGKRETSVGNQCVKETYSRLSSQQLPITTLSVLASRPLGSSLNDRNPASARPFGSTNQGLTSLLSSWIPSAWEQDLIFITVIIFVFAFIFYAGPTFLPTFGKAVGSLLEGIFGATSSILTGTGKAAGSLISATGTVGSDLEIGAADLAKARLTSRADEILSKGAKSLADAYAKINA
jgi:hypothetical protein